MPEVSIVYRTQGGEDAARTAYSVRDSIRSIAEIASGVALGGGISAIVQQVVQIGKELFEVGVQTTRQEEAFSRLTASLGVHGDAMLAAMQKASRGIVDTSDVMIQAVRGLQAGLAPEQLVSLMEVATAQATLMGTSVGEAFNRITSAIAENNARGLRSAEIMIDAKAAYETYAASIGTTADRLTVAARAQALYQATMEATKGTVAALTQEQLSQAQELAKVTTAWNNVRQSVGQTLAHIGAEIVKSGQQVATWAQDADKAATRWYAGLLDAAAAGKQWVASLIGVAPAAASATSAVEALDESTREVARNTSASARGLADMGTNSAAAADKFRATEAELKKLNDQNERLIKEGQRGWVEYADAVFNATEAEQKAEVAINDRARALEAAMLEKNTAGWVAYAEAAFAATEAEQKAEVAINDRARAQEQALLDKDVSGWVAYAEAVFAATEREQLAEVAINDRARAMETATAKAAAAAAATGVWVDVGKGIEGAFLSILDTGDKLVTGLIQGTLDIGDAFADLGQKLLANFVNVVIRQVFEPVLQAAASFVTGLLQMVTGAAGGGAASFAQASAQFGGFAPGAPGGTGAGGGGFGFGGIMDFGTSIISGVQNLPSIWNAAIQGWEAFSISLRIGASATDALSAGWSTLVQNLGSGVSTLGTVAAGLGAIYSLYSSITALSEGRTGAGIGGLVGLAVGGGIGFVASGFNPLGALFGAAIGGAAGGLFGGLFDEDWDLIHQLRSQQRERTGNATLDQTLDRIVGAESLDALVHNFQQSMAGTGTRLGDALLQMVTNYPGKTIFEDEVFNLAPEIAAGLAEFLRGEGFTPAEFSSGRVNSIGELLAASGLENWEALLEGLNAFIQVMQTAEENLQGLQGLSLDNLQKNAITFFETLRIAGTLGEMGFDAAAENIKAQLRAIAEGVEGGLEAIRQAAVDAVMADPTQLLRLVDVSQWQRDGEELEDTTARVGAALFELGLMMRGLEAEIAALQGTGPDVVEALRNAQAAIDEQLAGIVEAAATATDPSDILALAQQAYDLVRARYELEIQAVQSLMQEIQERTASIAQAGNTLAQNADWLMQAGIDLGQLGNMMAEFGRTMPTFAAKITALDAAIELFAASLGGAGQTGDINQILMGIVDSFQAAMTLMDPGQRLDALAAVMNSVGALLASLPEEQRDALLSAFGPEVRILVEAIQQAAAEQAAAAAAAAQQLQELLAGSGALTAENFIVQALERIAVALESILTYAGQALYDAINRALQDHGLQHGTGPMGQGGGLYQLHAPEIVIGQQESRSVQSGHGYYDRTGYHDYGGHAGASGVTVSVPLVVNVDARGASPSDADEIGRRVGRGVIDEIRHGQLGEEIVLRVKRA